MKGRSGAGFGLGDFRREAETVFSALFLWYNVHKSRRMRIESRRKLSEIVFRGWLAEHNI